MKREIVAGPCTKSTEGETTKITCNLDWMGEQKELWLTCPREFDQYVDIHSMDWVLASLLIPAMQNGTDLRLRGSLSSQLFYFASTDLQKILRRQRASFSSISISSESLECRSQRVDGYSGTGFSAGVDSLSSLVLLERDKSLKPTHLVTLNVGAMGDGEFADKILEVYTQRLNEYCSSEGYTPLIMNSNLHHFFGKLSHQATHTVRAAAAILAVGPAFSRYYYSSAFEYAQIGVQPTYDIAFADPILLPMLSTEATQFRAIGTHLSRLEKAELVADFPASYRYLDVCVSRDQSRIDGKLNCSTCWKCVRQIMSLEVLGRLKEYESVFELDAYERDKENLVYKHAFVSLSHDRPNDSDVIKLAQARGIVRNFNFDTAIKLANFSWKIKEFIARRIAKEYVKGVSTNSHRADGITVESH